MEVRTTEQPERSELVLYGAVWIALIIFANCADDPGQKQIESSDEVGARLASDCRKRGRRITLSTIRPTPLFIEKPSARALIIAT
jgi:hypothetical protein